MHEKCIYTNSIPLVFNHKHLTKTMDSAFFSDSLKVSLIEWENSNILEENNVDTNQIYCSRNIFCKNRIFDTAWEFSITDKAIHKNDPCCSLQELTPTCCLDSCISNVKVTPYQHLKVEVRFVQKCYCSFHNLYLYCVKEFYGHI